MTPSLWWSNSGISFEGTSVRNAKVDQCRFPSFASGKAAYNARMRRLLVFAAFLLIVSVVPVCAQRGGGHASGGSHGSMGGHSSFSGHSGFVGHSGGALGGPRFGSGFGSRLGSNFGSHSGSRFGSGTRFLGRGNRFRNGRFGFRNRCIGCFGYPYYGYDAGIDPYWWWNTYPSDDGEQRQIANEMNQQNLEEQQALREQDQDLYARQMPRPRPTQRGVSEKAENDPATILLFRDQHTREVQNYAIVDEMLWIFTPTRIEKVLLSALDVPATIQANENRGVDFRLPGVSQGQ